MSESAYIQQVHRGCGGYIVCVARAGTWGLACRRCATFWEISCNLGAHVDTALPADFCDTPTEDRVTVLPTPEVKP